MLTELTIKYYALREYNKMSKQVYISADYSMYAGDRDVVEELNK